MIPRLPILFAALALAGCAPSPAPPSVAAPPGGVLLQDRFDGENGGVPLAPYRGFREWTVSGAGVELRGGAAGDAAGAARGMFVALESPGATRPARLTSRAVLDLVPGMYQLSFQLAGPRAGEDTVTVHLAWWSSRIAVAAGAPFREEVHAIRIVHRARGRLWFRSSGADGDGPLLDDVVLRRIAE